jgi:hypothetical protein
MDAENDRSRMARIHFLFNTGRTAGYRIGEERPAGIRAFCNLRPLKLCSCLASKRSWQRAPKTRSTAIAEVVQRPTMKFVATKTADQLDLQALHHVRERLVGQRTGIAFLLERGVFGLRPTGSVATAIMSPAKNALTQKNIRISSALVMVILIFELTNATVARRRRSCNHLPVTGLGQY